MDRTQSSLLRRGQTDLEKREVNAGHDLVTLREPIEIMIRPERVEPGSSPTVRVMRLLADPVTKLSRVRWKKILPQLRDLK